jgi:hypothetical protein
MTRAFPAIITKARWNALDGIFMLVNQTGQIATSTTGIDP